MRDPRPVEMVSIEKELFVIADQCEIVEAGVILLQNTSYGPSLSNTG